MVDDNASAVDSAFDGDGDDGGAAPSSNPWCGCCADDAASSPDADDTGRDDADADDRRAAKRSPSMDKRRDCGRPSCRVLLSSNRYRRSIKKYVFLQKICRANLALISLVNILSR